VCLRGGGGAPGTSKRRPRRGMSLRTRRSESVRTERSTRRRAFRGVSMVRDGAEREAQIAQILASDPDKLGEETDLVPDPGLVAAKAYFATIAAGLPVWFPSGGIRASAAGSGHAARMVTRQRCMPLAGASCLGLMSDRWIVVRLQLAAEVVRQDPSAGSIVSRCYFRR